MDKFQITVTVVHRSQNFYETHVDSTAPMHCKSRGLINGNQGGIFQDNPRPESVRPKLGVGLRCAFLRSQRRHPDNITRDQPALRLAPTFINPDFSSPYRPIDPAFWDAGTYAQQVVVQALAGLSLVDAALFHFGVIGVILFFFRQLNHLAFGVSLRTRVAWITPTCSGNGLERRRILGF
jgi:hypothetical protein